MKKTLFLSLFFLSLLIILVSVDSFLNKKVMRLSHYYLSCVRLLLNHSILPTDKCWNKSRYSAIDDKYPTIYFKGNAPSDCLGPEYPLITIEDKGATHWIQIVKINIIPPDGKFSLKKEQWMFFDTTDEFQIKRIPFYHAVAPHPQFWDNPNWACFLNPFTKNHLNWEATLFSVSVEGNKITPRFAFSWGYRIDYKNIMIIPIAPQRIDLETWENFRDYFNNEYKEWNFVYLTK